MAEKAGRAAPAMAIAGALVASPQASHAFAKPPTVATAQAHKPSRHTPTATLDSIASHGGITSAAAGTRHAAAKAAARNISYKVRTGDTLSQIAERYYHNAGDWPWLYHENDRTIQNPNLIYTGQTLVVSPLPANYSPASYVPRHARPAASTARGSSGGRAATATVTAVTDQDSDGSRAGAPVGSGGSGPGGRPGAPKGSGGSGRSRAGGPVASGGSGGGVLGGQLGCRGLEDLWDAAGGNPADAFIAAEIAMAESGGDQYALSPTDDYGYWQINASHGSLATFNAYGNARAAIIISNDGADWYPWTTYVTGAYAGRC